MDDDRALDPCGAPEPVAPEPKRRSVGRKLAYGVAGTVAVYLAWMTMTPTMGANRSVRLKLEERKAEIARVIQQEDAKAPVIECTSER